MQITYKHDLIGLDNIDNQQIIEIILKNREINDIVGFINTINPLEISLKDLGYQKEVKKALKILEDIKAKGQMIVVYTDYDADGITGGAILWETLYLLGFKVMPYVPHRGKEGYGFSKIGIDFVKKQYDPALIISVDHGITAIEEIKYAKQLGIPVIITDHHIKGDKIPQEAEAIFHYSELSGSGVAYYFAKEVFNHFQKEHALLSKYFQIDYVVLATVGIVADLVPLVGNARNMVKYGLAQFSQISKLGLKALLKNSGIGDKIITTYDIGFIIAPRINAIGRLEHAIDALRLLCTTNKAKAENLSKKLNNTNKTRQNLVEQAVKEAILQVETKYKSEKMPKILILTSETWQEGIMGLIASKIVDKYYRPTLIIARSDGFWKASARSVHNVDITAFLRELQEYLESVGGHKQAAGFAIKQENIEKFRQKAIENAENTISQQDLIPVFEADIKIPLTLLNFDLIEEINKLQPFGVANPQPKFYSQIEINKVMLFGKEQNHLKLYGKDSSRANMPAIEFIGFNMKEQFNEFIQEKIANIVYTPEINQWNGNKNLRGKINYIEKC